jgi:putative tricarboxylic transport membrane protein
MAEQHFRRALQISQGDWSVFVTHPLSLAFLILAVLVFLTPFILRALENRLLAKAAQTEAR